MMAHTARRVGSIWLLADIRNSRLFKAAETSQVVDEVLNDMTRSQFTQPDRPFVLGNRDKWKAELLCGLHVP
jgi:hypothetical protein